MKYQSIILIALIFFCVKVQATQFPKILWSYWQQELDKNQMIKVFHENHKKMLQGWQINVVNKNTVYQYLAKIPYYKNDLDSYNYVLVQHKSNYIRCLLLSYYGGVWMDISSILLQDFSWLQIQNLRNNPDILNKYGDQPDIFYFTYTYSSKQKYFDQVTQKWYQVAPGYETWFTVAKPNTIFMKQLTDILRQGLQNDMYSNNGRYVDEIVQRQKIEVGQQIRYLDYLGFSKLLFILIQRKQRQLDAQTIKNNLPRQLVSWYYKIWHIRSENGPLFAQSRWKALQIDVMIKLSKQQIQKLTNKQMRYFVKLIGSKRKMLKNYLYRDKIADNDIKKTAATLQTVQFYQYHNFFCPSQLKIHKSSLIYQYYLKQHLDKFSLMLYEGDNKLIFQLCEPLIIFIDYVKLALAKSQYDSLQEDGELYQVFAVVGRHRYSVILIGLYISGLVLFLVNIFVFFRRYGPTCRMLFSKIINNSQVQIIQVKQQYQVSSFQNSKSSAHQY